MMMQHNEIAMAADGTGASIGQNALMHEGAEAHGFYIAECFDKDGKLKWRDTFKNVVCTGGKNDALDKYFAGSAYTAAWYLGLIHSTNYSAVDAADTMASHAGWEEGTAYSAGTRPAPSWNAAGSGSKATTATSFSINGTTTIKGAFMTTNSTKGGTTGILYSAGLFSGGDKSCTSGDTLNVTWTGSL